MDNKCLETDYFEQLNKFKSEVDSYQKCVESSLLDLNNLNIKYEKTVREISSIFDLFQHINLITDYNNLYTIINDMLIGVLGVTSSTIFSLNEEGLVVEASNIARQDLKDIQYIKDKLIGAGCLEGKLVIFKSEEIQDKICLSRGIQSAAAIPLMKKDKCMGLIFLEHVLEEYFKEESKQFFTTLSIAVRLSIENAQLYSSLENMALRDGMTGLYNNMYFHKELQNCIEVHHKYGLPFMLCLVDIDNFKQMNTEKGHLFGDLVIKHVGRLLEAEVRKGDIVCRCEGDKFAVIFRNTQDTKAIRERMEEIRVKLGASPIVYEDSSSDVSCSFGLASSKCCETEQESRCIVEYAEKALQGAKEQGKNRVMVYEG